MRFPQLTKILTRPAFGGEVKSIFPSIDLIDSSIQNRTQEPRPNVPQRARDRRGETENRTQNHSLGKAATRKPTLLNLRTGGPP